MLILFVLVMIVLLLPWETYHRNENETARSGGKAVTMSTRTGGELALGVELQPMAKPPQLSSTFDAWQLLLGRAKASLDIVSPH